MLYTVFDATEYSNYASLHILVSTNRIDDVVANVGANGFDDRLEVTPDNNVPNYSLADSEVVPDGIPDICDLDSDDDQCNDSLEEGVLDPDDDGLAGSGIPIVDLNGLVDTIMPYIAPPNDVWRDANAISSTCGCRVIRFNPHVSMYRRPN